MLKAVEAVGSTDNRDVQATIGEAIAWRNLFWGLRLDDAEPRAVVGHHRAPESESAQAYRITPPSRIRG